METTANRVSPPKVALQSIQANFVTFFGVFTAIYLVSWPIVFSLDLWILKDRGSFLNLDYLLDKHLRLGVDTFYSYGLLPVAIQHWLFVLFGRGYWPLLGCAVATMALMAVFCAFFLRGLPSEPMWLVAMLAMSRILNPVNPNLPYSIVQLSLLFALLFVLLGRMDVSLAIAAVGCWSVPSLPLVMAGLLAAFLFLDWLIKPHRSLQNLLRAFAPGVLTYLGLAILLAFEFGWRSVLATATPLAGMGFYKQIGFGTGEALMQFLHPSGYDSRFYLAYSLFTPVSWWVVSTLSLLVFAILAARRMVIQRALNPRDMVIVLCSLIQGVFVCVAYGSPHQHYVFDPILVVGMLLGLSATPKGIARNVLVTLFLGLGIAGQATLAHAVFQGWKEIKSPTVTANLYANPGWVAEWKKILETSSHENLLLFAYSTGAHHYFPSVHSPDVWTLQVGQLLPADKARVIEQLDNADVVVLDLTSPTSLVEMDAEIRQRLSSHCLAQSTNYFQVWWRRSSQRSNLGCIADPRR
ncbi:MAG: hypothetical protein ABSC76_09750 [Terracidiphilus sp.]|jgi:hypothetical protein